MFTHLHLHTEYSLLDGAIRLKDLFAKAKEYGYKALAMTDHGVMYGALKFYLQAVENGIKPLIGCELYVSPTHRTDRHFRSPSEAAFHLVLLAMNQEGYKNLMKLVTIANFEGFYYKPRVDKEVLAQHNQGLIALSACLHGEIAHKCLVGDEKGACALTETYASIFKGRFYLELQENGLEEQKQVNKDLLHLSKTLGIPVVATNDCHYLNQEDYKAHDLLLCIQTGKTVSDEKRMRFSTDQLYFASPEEMEKRFSWCPEAIAATQEIADRCNVEITTGKHFFPVYKLKQAASYEEEFEALARKGLKKRLSAFNIPEEQHQTYWDRLEFEMEVIEKKGFPSYFLIVADFIGWAKKQGIPVGPGRGSAAGSLVAFSMGITDIDPVKYGLFFERFLNVERTSLPDIDVDFCMIRRPEVIHYVTRQYGGEDHVAQIITFGQMKAKAVIRDVGRAMGMPYSDVDRIAKLVPDALKMTLDKAIEMEPKLKELAENDVRVKELLTVARALEGLPRHSSTHAAGVVISDHKPMVEYLPLTKGQEGETITQFDMKDVEKAGLIKFDFLGLKTLTVIDTALKLIERHYGKKIDLSGISLDDAKTYELLCRGDTTGVFQLESPGMKNLIKRMRPSTFTDLIALVALYRPGPLESGMVNDFVDGKHGKKEVKYLLPQLEPILKETYGVIVYQEQVMKIAQELAGYSLGEGDLLRRAMGKKVAEVMDAQKERFMSGALERDIPREKAEFIFDLMAKFAGYGFNKSHSAAYALISYRTAWLKAHYPVPFMASLLSNELGQTDGVVKFLSECRSSGIEVLPPHINRSFTDFTIEEEKIRFGLSAVKNVGTGAIEKIVQEREARGKFESYQDFLTRVDLRKVNRKVMESLIKSGALDCFGHTRAALFHGLDDALEFAHKKQREKSMGQKSLFDLAVADGSAGLGPQFQVDSIPEWPELQKLSHEKEALGFYLSGHPLDQYREQLEKMATTTTFTLDSVPNGQKIGIAGIVRNIKEKLSKRGKMAFVHIEDLHGSIEAICFAEAYSRCSEILKSDEPLWFHGTIKHEGDGTAGNNNGGPHAGSGDQEEQENRSVKLLLDSAEPLERVCSRRARALVIELDQNRVESSVLSEIKRLIARHQGDFPVQFRINVPGAGIATLELPDQFSVFLNPELTKEINRTVGYPSVSIDYEHEEDLG